ncbi:MAG: hypothetical protein ACYCPT_08830 [Acidimicrobiales bacterium]
MDNSGGSPKSVAPGSQPNHLKLDEEVDGECLFAVVWSSEIWPREFARRQESTPLTPVDDVSLASGGNEVRTWLEHVDEPNSTIDVSHDAPKVTDTLNVRNVTSDLAKKCHPIPCTK